MMRILAFFPILLTAGLAAAAEHQPSKAVPPSIAPFFQPPAGLAGDPGGYRSPLTFDDGRPVTNAREWKARRKEILRYWHGKMGPWPPLIERPAFETLSEERRGNVTQRKVRFPVAPGRTTDGYLLIPDGKGPFPAVVTVYYEPETAVALGKEPLRDFALQLAKRGFVTLSIGSPYTDNYPAPGSKVLQPLSFLAYLGANAYNAVAGLPQVDPERVGIAGHSYGGKWAMFASCLNEKYACAVWSDPGIVFDEKRSNVNYWEPWYLGFDPNARRRRGVVTPDNPRTGAYKEIVAEGHDLHELHALMAPRPFLVSGGSEDQPERWKALNHAVAVNRLLGCSDRVAMTNRPAHSPTPESNEQIYTFFEWALSR